MNKFLNVLSKLQALSVAKKVVTAVATAVSIAIVGGGAVVGVATGGNEEPTVESSLFVETTEETESVFETETETMIETEEETTTEEPGDITVTIKSTTIYQDLKIKIVNQKGNLVKGYPFEVVVTPVDVEDENGKVTTPIEFKDHDMDGIMHLKEILGGQYVIELKELEGIIISKNSVKAKVEGELKYEKVDNKDEIKKDDASQDTAENNVVVEAVLKDTIPLLESKPYPVEVAKDKVNFSNFPAASVGKEITTTTLNKMKKVEPTEVSIISVETYTLMSAYTLGENTRVSSTAAAIETVAAQNVDGALGYGVAPIDDETPQPVTEATVAPETTQQAIETTQQAPETTQQAPETTQQATETTTSAANNGSSENSTQKDTEKDTEGDTEEPSSEAAIASAEIKLPKTATLYYYGNDASKKVTIPLEVTDKDGIIVENGIQWSVSDANVVDMKVASDKKSVELVAKKAGKVVVLAKVTYVSGDDGSKTTSEISCSVEVGNHSDNTTHIKDTSNQPLYIDGEAKKIATPANYATASKLYTTPKYTGWQTVNGKLYYFKADNTPATGNQVIGGVQYSFNSDGSLIPSKETYGIDVSKWQGNIDWKAVAQSGVKFAIIRCAYRGAKDGLIHEDPYFKANIKGATQNGIKVGVYFFSQAINEVEAIEEASMSIGLVQGYYLNFPMFIDTEKATNGRANSLDRATRTRVVKAFCETVRNSGYKPGIYASKSWYNNNLDMSQLSSYNIWVAQYNTSCNYTGRYDMWQYTDAGSVPGIKGNVDMNKCYTNY